MKFDSLTVELKTSSDGYIAARVMQIAGTEIQIKGKNMLKGGKISTRWVAEAVVRSRLQAEFVEADHINFVDLIR